ncbi:glycyl radical protein [Chloroflexota bacterium]
MITKMETKENRALTSRVARLKQSLLETKPRLSTERVRCLLESYRETEGQAPAIRRAKAFEKLLEEMTIFIDENPIVGTQTQYRCGLQPYPEFSCEWMLEETEASTSLGETMITKEDREWLEKAVDYWKDKCKLFTANELWEKKHAGEPSSAELEEAVLINTVPTTKGRINVDYGKVVSKGLRSVIEEARQQLESLPISSLEALRKREFLEAVIIACSAVIKFAQRYAFLAKDMAEKETNLERRMELEKIYETCLWVPSGPARNFYEAVQSFWFVHLACEIEEPADGRTPGRFGQYMYPVYKKDREEGGISEEDAIELLELLYIKFTEVTQYLRRLSFAGQMGNMFQNINIGGVTADGDDATTELDYLLIEAQRRVQLIQPTLSVLYHNKLSEKFLMDAVELVKTGIGMPAFFNNDTIVQGLIAHGVSLEDARNCCIVGCVERGISHTMAGLKCAGGTSMPKFLELVLNNGRDPLTGRQLGPQTGEAEAFQSYDELEEAVKRQFQYFLRLKMEWTISGAAITAETLPNIFISALVDDCIKEGRDIWAGGSRYAMDGSTPVGMVDLADSLVAIKKLVFEEKRISMRQLKDAVAADFEGHEALHHILLEAPKYGNDDDYVDLIAKKWYDLFEREHQKYTNHLGQPLVPFAGSVTFHSRLGKTCGALPSGRKSRLAFADASVSAYPGMDKNGPTALIRSATKVVDTIKYASGQMNMKLHPAALKTREGCRKLLGLIKTYMDLGGHHIQFNVVSAEALKEAQLHPENYRNLIVRVAGFSAYFVYLDVDVQNEIIRRTEVSL